MILRITLDINQKSSFARLSAIAELLVKFADVHYKTTKEGANNTIDRNLLQLDLKQMMGK